MRYFLIFCILSMNIFTDVQAQGKLEDYKRAAEADNLFGDKVYAYPDKFNWSQDNNFWYVNKTRDGNKFILVLPEKKLQMEAFDHTLLSNKLSSLLGREIPVNDLPIKDIEFFKDRTGFTFVADTLQLSVNLNNYEVQVIGAEEKENGNTRYWGGWDYEQEPQPVASPDKSLLAYIRNNNVYIKDIESDKEFQLSYDGSKGFYYTGIRWSPDSGKIMAYKLRPGEEHKIYFVESSPEDQLQPKVQERDYLKPGDQLEFRSPQLFNVKKKEHIKIPTSLFNSQYSLSNFEWRDDSSAFTFEYNERGHQIYRILKVDAVTGDINVLIEESSPTFIDYSGKKYRHDLKDGKGILWASERDGWNHLYLFDRETGKLKNQITRGEWPVREVLKIDEENRRIYFTASGVDARQDPYFIHYFAVDFDGNNLIRFTTENGNHKVSFSPDYNYYVDQYSRIDLPPVTVLKKTSNQKKVMDLQTADISDLLKTSWKAPETFTAKGRDGVTDIWGMIVRPSTFDPTKKYPIIEYIYAGPHGSFVPKDFSSYYVGMTSLAELGFIVVKIDGMGTSNRSKAFQDVAWKNLKDAGFPDRKLWIKAAAEKFPYLDIDKVGIHGRSAGGQSSSGALIFHSDFYDVAVSSSGCHDNRMDKIWWNEQWMGYPVGVHYSESSNVDNADNLEGNLMLIVGELDDNVDPASTFQFANALIKANKDFELVYRPGVGHSAGNHEYDIRKRRDFFVQHLMGVTPPAWAEIYSKEDLVK